MIRRAALALIAVLAVWLAAPSPASATCILCTCTINATDVAFGNFQPLDNALKDSTGVVTVTCGPIGVLADYDVKLTTGGSGAFATRRMVSGANTLSYNLYTSAARTTIWGDGTGGTGKISDAWLIILGNTSRSYTIHGRVPATTTAIPGAYTDTVIARVEF